MVRASVERMCYRRRLARVCLANVDGQKRRLRLRFDSDGSLRQLDDSRMDLHPDGPLPKSALYLPGLYERLRESPAHSRLDALWLVLLSDLGVRGLEPGADLHIGCQMISGTMEFELRIAACTTMTVSPAFEPWAGALRLSAREGDVAGLLVQGLRNAEIASALGISLRTVENHLRAVFGKAGVRSRTRLLRHYLDRAEAEH